MKKFQKTGKRYCEICKTLRDDCREFIREVLEKQNDSRLNIHTYDENGKQKDQHYISVCWSDEKSENSTMYAEFESLYIGKDDSIFLELVGYGEYSIDFISVSELYDICQFIVDDMEIA